MAKDFWKTLCWSGADESTSECCTAYLAISQSTLCNMAIFRSGNPVLKASTFEKSATATDARSTPIEGSVFLPNEGVTGTMTERGTLNKFFFLFVMVMGAATFAWYLFDQGANLAPWVMGSAIGGLVLALIISFRPTTAPYLAPAYALVKGIFVGGISAMYSYAFTNIDPFLIQKSVALTFGVVLAMYGLYRFGVIRATQKFKAIVLSATLGIAVFYLIALGMQLFGLQMPFLHESSPLGIGLSLVLVSVAALNLILDFDMIETGVATGAPKHMEWYGAFGLTVTIIWLYVEMLRLMSKISRR